MGNSGVIIIIVQGYKQAPVYKFLSLPTHLVSVYQELLAGFFPIPHLEKKYGWTNYILKVNGFSWSTLNSWRAATSNEFLVICHDFTMCSSMKLHASHMAVAIAMPKSANYAAILLVALLEGNLHTSYIWGDKMFGIFLALCSILSTIGKLIYIKVLRTWWLSDYAVYFIINTYNRGILSNG